MKKTLLLPVFALFALALAGCTTPAQPTTPDVQTETDSQVVAQYTADSRKEMIPDSCQSFYDGCNHCNKMEGDDIAACTKMYCEIYSEPYCKDELPTDETNQGLDNDTLTSIYVGLSVDEAIVEASKRATAFRVVEIDWQGQAVTMDYRPGRINATVNNGFVTAIDIEGSAEML